MNHIDGIKKTAMKQLEYPFAQWLERAEALKPALHRWETPAAWLVEVHPDVAAWQNAAVRRLSAACGAGADALGKAMCWWPSSRRRRSDAFTFGCARQTATGFPCLAAPHPGRTAGGAPAPGRRLHRRLESRLAARGIIHVDDLPCRCVYRRYSCRYLRIEVLGSPGKSSSRRSHHPERSLPEALPASPPELPPQNARLTAFACAPSGTACRPSARMAPSATDASGSATCASPICWSLHQPPL